MSQQAGPSRMHPDDPDFEEWCLRQLSEDYELLSDGDEDCIIDSDHDSESEQSGDENSDDNGQEAMFENDDGTVGEEPPIKERKMDFFYGREKKSPTIW